MALTTNQDFLDVIDLDSALETGSGYPERTKQNTNGPGTGRYNISLESITDDELRYVTRSLITPISFQNHRMDDRFRSYARTPSVTRQRIRPSPRNEQVPTFRSESAAIFNRLADDELSMDFATRDLSEFMDSALLEQVISRPGSRVPRSHVNDGATAITGIVQPPASDPLRPHRTEGLSKNKERQRNDVGLNTISADFERNQHAKLTPKRHSLHGDILMALRRDSDALLQRRESLLKLRKFSEGHQPRSDPQYQSNQQHTSDHIYQSESQYHSVQQNHKAHRQIRPTPQSDHQSTPETPYKDKDTPSRLGNSVPLDTFKLKKENQFIKITSGVSQKKTNAQTNEPHQIRDDREPRLERKSSYLSVPIHQESSNRNQITETFSGRSKRPTPPASVTESAKNLLARVRQHRVEEKDLPFRKHDNGDRRRRSDSRWRSPDQTTRQTLLLDEYTPGHGSNSLSEERTKASRGTGNRRWSSSLPLSNTQYSPIRQDKVEETTRNQPSSRYSGHYVAKKSALDRSTDRYMALLGKPSSSK